MKKYEVASIVMQKKSARITCKLDLFKPCKRHRAFNQTKRVR